MNDQEYYIKETDWGLHVTNDENCLDEYQIVSTNLKAIIQSCAERDIKRILCESRKTKPLMSIIELYQLATNLAAWKAFRIRIAYLMPHFVESESTLFFETAAINRAITIKFFAEKQRAISWLINDQASPE